MEMTSLGRGGPQVSAIGLGCMGMSDFYGPADMAEGVATIHAALEAGVTMLNTGDFYGMGHNEMLIADALAAAPAGRRERAFIAVKFGAQRDPSGAFIGFDARPQAVKSALAYTLKRLRTDHIDLYQPARVDPKVPIEDTVGAVKELIQAGYVRHLGLSEASAATVRRVHAIHPVAALEVEYSLVSRDIERDVLPTLRELGIALVPYGVLSRGLLSGRLAKASDLDPGDMRHHMPRFQGANLERNLKLVDTLKRIAAAKGVTPSQLAIAWVRAQGPGIVTLVGARRRAQLAEALGALAVTLSAEERRELEAAVPAEAVAGTRYAAPQMAMLNG